MKPITLEDYAGFNPTIFLSMGEADSAFLYEYSLRENNSAFHTSTMGKLNETRMNQLIGRTILSFDGLDQKDIQTYLLRLRSEEKERMILFLLKAIKASSPGTKTQEDSEFRQALVKIQTMYLHHDRLRQRLLYAQRALELKMKKEDLKMAWGLRFSIWLEHGEDYKKLAYELKEVEYEIEMVETIEARILTFKKLIFVYVAISS